MPGNGERQLHHGSHRNLLDSAAGTPLTPEKIDAIFVPTFRSPAYLTKAARLSVALACPLVTLHSGKWTSAAEAVRRLRPRVAVPIHWGTLKPIYRRTPYSGGAPEEFAARVGEVAPEVEVRILRVGESCEL